MPHDSPDDDPYKPDEAQPILPSPMSLFPPTHFPVLPPLPTHANPPTCPMILPKITPTCLMRPLALLPTRDFLRDFTLGPGPLDPRTPIAHHRDPDPGLVDPRASVALHCPDDTSFACLRI